MLKEKIKNITVM